MKILLTGADGQLGRCLQDVFAASQHTLVAMGRSQLNITDDIAVARVVEREAPDVILNAAAYTAVDKAEAEPELASQINVLGPALLASAASKYGCLLVHISTDYVFDGTKPSAYLEEDEVSPLGVYGSSKLRGEIEVQRRCLKHVVLRTSWVFGETGSNFPKTMLRLAADRSEISVVSDEYGCPTYTGDIANTCLEVVKAYAESNLNYGVYH